MAFSFFRWIRGLLGGTAEEITTPTAYTELWDSGAGCYIRELAVGACQNLVANALCKCEFKTYLNGAETQGSEYFLWNYSPNLNQSAVAFRQKLIYQLFRTGEALVVEQGGQLLIADNFMRVRYTLYDDVFSQVTVGDFTFERSFLQSEVMYFQLTENNARLVVDGLYNAYKGLIDYSMKSYKKSRGSKGVLEVDATAAGNKDFTKNYEDLKNKQYKEFTEKESAILPLFRGLKYIDLGSKTYSNEGTRDIRAMIDDVTDFTARAYGIPPTLVNGSVQDVASAIDQLLTFCIDPLCRLLVPEINRKRSGKAGIAAGTYLKIDTHAIKHIDLLSQAASIDKLVSSGIYCVNDIRGLLGETLINEPWAWRHFMTKNYAEISDLLDSLGNADSKGGENTDETGNSKV